jgi:hypothetical protein
MADGKLKVANSNAQAMAGFRNHWRSINRRMSVQIYGCNRVAIEVGNIGKADPAEAPSSSCSEADFRCLYGKKN